MVIAVSRWPKPITGYRQLAGGDAATSPRPSTGPWQLFNWIETSNLSWTPKLRQLAKVEPCP
jgi:hypothetical protein